VASTTAHANAKERPLTFFAVAFQCLAPEGIARNKLVFDMASPQRLLLRALLNGLGDAVSRNDGAAADRYHRRLGMIAPHFDTNPSVSDALEHLLWASSQWSATNVAERYDAGQQVLELIENTTGLL
jgi:hypothetical protein